MTNRERLIELKINFVENFDCGDCKPSNNKCRKCLSEKEADYLLEHGVIVLPCNVGTRHNKLTFISVDEEKTKEKHRTYYLLRCDCGNIVSVRKDCWESGSTKACGCLYETHGQAKGEHTRLYNIYHGMKKRCYNLMSKSYKDYGGRGIKMCDEWLSDFVSFYKWAVANGYKDNLTIERIDVNGNYEPNNCKWVTITEQHKNTRKITPVRIVETGKVFASIADCARHLNGSGGNISNCLNGKLESYKGYHFEKLTREEAEKALKEQKNEGM